MPRQPGARLGPYEVVALIGAGGMGEVWLATELRLGRKVALKLLPADLTRDSVRIQRFEQEARAASALNHPNVCTIHALGETDEAQHYIAMEFVEGDTLRQRLATSRLSLREALDIAIQVAAALSVAHAAGIVHRDIKPENVMLRPDGVVKVLDFGLAKLAAVGPPDADTTQLGVNTHAGTVLGTAAYMSPEQARGQQVDARTDIWSLGVLLYEMVAGRSPFAAPSGSDVLAAILQNEPAPVARFEPDAPAELQRILTKTLRKDRSQRYQTVPDLLLDLQTLREHSQSHGRSGSAPVPAITTEPAAIGSSSTVLRTHPGGHVWFAVAAAVLVLGTILGVWAWRTAHSSTTRAAPTAQPVQRNLTRLTVGPGLQTDVTWSPDGRFIAYASDRNGNFDIWVQSVGGGDPVQITRSPAADTKPDWSPDGSSLVFRSERDGGGLFLVPALGGMERQLTSFGTSPSWSRDRSEILFVDATGWGLTESTVRLYAVSPDDGNTQEILTEFLAQGAWSWISRHPDGRISVLGRHRQRGPGFFTTSRDGTRVVTSAVPPEFPLRLHEGGILVRRRFQWHPSGTALYLQTQSGGVYNLWKVPTDPKTLAWLSAERLTTGPGPDLTPALSRDGSRLAFSSEREASRLWMFPFEASARRLGTGTPLTDGEATVSNSTVSPDGQWVLYNLTRPGMPERGELWMTRLLDGHSEMVTMNAIAACWSRDSTMMAYSSFAGDRLRTVVRDIGGRERFVSRWSAALFVPTDWTADGRLLGSYRAGMYTGDASLVLWPTTNPDADKPERVLLSRPGASFWQAKLSPNRKWVSFVVLSPTRPIMLAVASTDGRESERWRHIAADHPSSDKPRWSPDGRVLYFLSRRPTSFFNLWAVGFDPERGSTVGEPFALSNFDSPYMAISQHTDHTEMSVTSHHAILTMTTVTGSVWMLDNVDK